MATLIDNKLIFSDERKYRITRHLLFWGFWALWFGGVRWLSPYTFKSVGHFSNPVKILIETFFFILPHMIIVYSMLYFILPRYIVTGKYIIASTWIVVLLILTACISTILLISIPWDKIGLFISFKVFQPNSKPINIWTSMQTSYLSAMLGALTAAALATSFKLFKHFYLKNFRIHQLVKENIAAQLQILRAQVHPHFLFNTLNNIFSQTQTESQKGSGMIMGLSDTLRYILYEGQKPLVPLKKELLMINEYIHLEKIRHENKLDVHVLMPDKTDNIYIAPLLLLPFIENSFKHGVDHALQNPWVNLSVELRNTTLVMKLMNGKLISHDNDKDSLGMGISNVKQRLELLYNGKYHLQVMDDDDVFIVDLSIELVRKADNESNESIIAAQSFVTNG